jgi:hypothetical protein
VKVYARVQGSAPDQGSRRVVGPGLARLGVHTSQLRNLGKASRRPFRNDPPKPLDLSSKSKSELHNHLINQTEALTVPLPEELWFAYPILRLRPAETMVGCHALSAGAASNFRWQS